MACSDHQQAVGCNPSSCKDDSVTNQSCTHHSCIAIVPIFNHLDDQQMQEIGKAVRPAVYKKNELIYRAGDPSEALYIVNKGKIKIYRLSESGKEQIHRILTAGDFTGELALFKETTHDSYAEALEDTQVCIIRREDMQHYLLQYPAIALKILHELSQRLEAAEIQAVRFSSEKTDTRIALYLAECADADGSADGNSDQPNLEFELPMSRKDLASYLGTTPETISRKLAEFEEAGYIEQITHRRIRIRDLDGLLMI